MIRRPPRSTRVRSSAASDVYKRQETRRSLRGDLLRGRGSDVIMLNPQAAEPSRSDGVDPAPKPTRRSFTAEYRAKVLAEYEAAPHGEKSAVLRREGIHQTQVAEWAKARDAATC